MNRKLIITTLEKKILTSVLENDEIVEFHCTDAEEEQTPMLDDIYIGKVKNIVQNIQAAFVEVTKGVECYYAIDHNPAPIFTNKIGKKPLCIGDELVVQISKEAVKTKVPTVSSNLNFAGKYAVLTTNDTRISVSKKLSTAEKERLQRIALPYASNEYGFILRTNAKELDEDSLKQELERLIQEYQTLTQIAQTRVCHSCLKKANRAYLTELRNIYQEGLTDIIVEDVAIYEETKHFLEQNQPEDLDKLRLYQDKLLPLHKLYSIEKHLEDALKERVWLKSGAYLVIQPTEALTVIDVNTGKCLKNKADERAYLQINLEAAKEVAKQIRLRNLSGIILIDFINLSNQTLKNELLDYFNRELKKDPILTILVDMTKLQLVEVTRKKVKKPLKEAIK